MNESQLTMFAQRLAAGATARVSGLLSLSRNAGLIAGASVMGAVFAFGAGTDDVSRASPPAVAAGLQLTFLLAAGLMVLALAVTTGHRLRNPTNNR